MKTRLSSKWTAWLGFAILPLLGACSKSGSSGEQAAFDQSPEPVVASSTVTNEEDSAVGLGEAEDDQGLSQAAVKSLSTEKPVPPGVELNEAIEEIIRLAGAGIDPKVMLTYVTNSDVEFNLGPDEIIYLNDLGVPSDIVTAMLTRDRALRENVALMPGLANIQSEPETAPTLTAALVPPPQSKTLPNQATLVSDYATEPYPPPSESYAPPTEVYPPPNESAPMPVDNFYGNLAPYGTWVDLEGYGRCWQPSIVSVDSGWQPYCDGGHWVYTDCGWYWVSDYSWGWAPFHYGRWFRHTRLGWCWVPDSTWGPSWVSWRYSDDYCGWAPLPPGAAFTAAGFTYYKRPVNAAFTFGLTADCYTFVAFNRFDDHHLSRHRLPHGQANHLFHRTVACTSFGRDHDRVTNNGLTPDRVAVATHRPVHRTTVREIASSTVNGGRNDRNVPGNVAADSQLFVRNRVPDRQPASPTQPVTAALAVSEIRQTGSIPAPSRRDRTATAPRQMPNELAINQPQATTLEQPNHAPSTPAMQLSSRTATQPPKPAGHILVFGGGDERARPRPDTRRADTPSWLVRPATSSPSQNEPGAPVSQPAVWRNNWQHNSGPQQTALSVQAQPETSSYPARNNHGRDAQPRLQPVDNSSPVSPNPPAATTVASPQHTAPQSWPPSWMHSSQPSVAQQPAHAEPVSHHSSQPAAQTQAHSTPSANSTHQDSTPAASSSSTSHSSHTSRFSDQQESRGKR